MRYQSLNYGTTKRTSERANERTGAFGRVRVRSCSDLFGFVRLVRCVRVCSVLFGFVRFVRAPVRSFGCSVESAFRFPFSVFRFQFSVLCSLYSKKLTANYRLHCIINLLSLFFTEPSFYCNGYQIILCRLNAVIYRGGMKTIHAIAWQ